MKAPQSQGVSFSLEGFAIDFAHNGCFESDDHDALRKALMSYLPNKLPGNEALELMGQLITDPRMRGAWEKLAKHFKHPEEAYCFVKACGDGKAGWRRSSQRTSAEQRAHFKAIQEAALTLQRLMNDAPEFDFYAIDDLVNPQSFQDYLENLLVAHNFDLGVDGPPGPARRYLAGVIPTVREVLKDIAKKASTFGAEAPAVKKPNSANAEVHFFIRWLSRYLRRHYGQPMNEVVTNTVSVVFDLPDIEYDTVKKIAAGAAA